MAATFDQVELYRHTSSLEGKTRAWCAANATKIYEGTAETFGDTGLTASTQYYYRLFAKYEEGGSGGGLYQQWSGYPDSPVLTSSKPYQVIVDGAGDSTQKFLLISSTPFYPIMWSGDEPWLTNAAASFTAYEYSGGIWANPWSSSQLQVDSPLLQANAPVYTSSALSTVYFAQTTQPVVEPTITYSQGISASEMTDAYVNPYQEWSGYPQSPVLTSEYPYQVIAYNNGLRGLYVSKNPLYCELENTYGENYKPLQNHKYYGSPRSAYLQTIWYSLTNGVWKYQGPRDGMITTVAPGTTFAYVQCNNNIYTDSSLSTVRIQKTT